MTTSRQAGRPHAVILAAGLGRRLRPLTDHTPKPLVEVGGRPIITYGIELLRQAGIEDIVINVHHLADRVRDSLGDGSRHGVRIRYSIEEELLDSGGGIRQAAQLLETPIDGPIVVLNADVVSWVPLRQVLAYHCERNADLTLVLRDDPRKHEYGVFGLRDDGRIGRFLGRGGSIDLPEFMFASVQVLSPGLLGRMPPGAFSSMRSLYPSLFDQGLGFYGWVYDGPWYTADTPEDVAATDAALRRRASQATRPDEKTD
jgi:NDP-sugar pyrophosphorylase family protein